MTGSETKLDKDHQYSIQKHFLKKLESVIPSNTSLASELSDVLEISSDSTYRRLRGETSLSLDEAIKLCEHFNISLDSLGQQPEGLVTFKYNNLKREQGGFAIYLEALLKDLKAIRAVEYKKIVYASEDIPVFHNFNHLEVSAFKMFYWMKSILNVPELQGESFSISKIPQHYLDLGKQIYEEYANIPSIEIWTETTIQGTIKQIEFYHDAGIFESKEDALNVCEALRKELTHIQSQAEASHKFTDNNKNLNEESNYTVYFSEIEITNNCVLVEMGETKSVYLGHLSFNTISTVNQKYSEATQEWLNVIIKKSTLISGISEKHRYQFFKKAFQVLDRLIEKIEKE